MPPPGGEVFIVGGDGSPEPGRPERHRHGAVGTGRRAGVAVGIAVVFVFGVVVGRTSIGSGAAGAGGSPAATSPAAAMTPTTAISPTGQSVPLSPHSPSAAPDSTRNRGGTGTSAASSGAPMLNPALAAAIELPVPGRSDIQSMAAVDGHLVVLTPGYLIQISYGSDGGLYPSRQTAVGLPIGDPSYATWELLSDGHRLWAISLGRANRVYLINPTTLQPVSEWNATLVSGTVEGAVALDGHLYLNTSSGVYDVSPATRRIGEDDVVARGGQAIAADPTRHRLLVLNDDGEWAVYAYRPPGFHPAESVSLPFQARSIAVAGGSIWVAGTSPGPPSQPALVRLDPSTLTVAGRADAEQTLPLAPIIVAQGTSLWIRNGYGGGELWCVNPHTGAVEQHWAALPGILLVHGGYAFVADGTTIGRPSSGICTG